MPKGKAAYRACFMAFDGECKIEGWFATIEEAWEHHEDVGSRWYFYPFPFVVTDGGIVVGTPAPELWWRWADRRWITTVARVFKTVSALPEMQNSDISEFGVALRHYAEDHNLTREDPL